MSFKPSRKGWAARSDLPNAISARRPGRISTLASRRSVYSDSLIRDSSSPWRNFRLAISSSARLRSARHDSGDDFGSKLPALIGIGRFERVPLEFLREHGLDTDSALNTFAGNFPLWRPAGAQPGYRSRAIGKAASEIHGANATFRPIRNL